MAGSLRGLQSIRTMGVLVDKRRARTTAGALLELSAMANEKLLLQNEMTRWQRRSIEIQHRLAEISAKEKRLLALVQDPANSPENGPPTIEFAAPHRMRNQEFSY